MVETERGRGSDLKRLVSEEDVFDLWVVGQMMNSDLTEDVRPAEAHGRRVRAAELVCRRRQIVTAPAAFVLVHAHALRPCVSAGPQQSF